MFNIFKQSPKGENLTFKINGLHCTSCCLSIDSELEDLDGVYRADTNFAKAKTVVDFDPKKITSAKIKQTIENLGYQVSKA